MTAQDESDTEKLPDRAHSLSRGDRDTIVDCLYYVETSIQDGEPPFDPQQMDEDNRQEWLKDIAAAERAINPYVTEG
jgi:hypothetical protein